MQGNTLEARQVEAITDNSKRVEEELHKLGLKIKHHEANLRLLKNQTNNLDESILDMQVSLGRYYSSKMDEDGRQDQRNAQSEQETIDQILQKDQSAASILCQLTFRHGSQAINSPLNKGVLGIVARLAKVNNDNLSRLLSEYLGLETMLAIVCKTVEGVEALELYNKEGQIDKSAGLHGLGSSIGRPLDGRFLVICLEELRPYAGKFVADDPQRRLDLMKPKLPNGECPSGFLGFAVNMIDIDIGNLSWLTPGGHGLRETLFYNLLSRLQVYKTRSDMQRAFPCISHGAISLDGGMIKSSGVYNIGSRKDVEVRFPISAGSSSPVEILNLEQQIKRMKWERERIGEDMEREEAVLEQTRSNFDLKKQEFMKHITEASLYAAQNRGYAGR